MEYLYGSLEGRCSEAVCRPVRVLEIRNGHVSSSGYREKTEVGAFSLGDECGSPFLLLFASHSPAPVVLWKRNSESCHCSSPEGR